KTDPIVVIPIGHKAADEPSTKQRSERMVPLSVRDEGLLIDDVACLRRASFAYLERFAAGRDFEVVTDCTVTFHRPNDSLKLRRDPDANRLAFRAIPSLL